jgi:group I intron endonuclease
VLEHLAPSDLNRFTGAIMANLPLPRAGIYCIRNIISGRKYVGSSVDIKNRWKNHRVSLRSGTHDAKAMQRSWIKHGEAAFEFTALEAVADLLDLIAAEQRWIDELDAANPRTGFNSSPTAGNCLGVRHTDETKAKHSLAQKGVPKSAEHRKAIGDAHRGRTIPEERRLRVAEGVRKHFAENPEARERMREVGRRNGSASKGRKMSAEVCEARSAMLLSDKRFADVARCNLSKATPEQIANGRLKSAAGRKGRPNRSNRSMPYERAEEIRALKCAGLTYDQLEDRFALNRATIFHIVKRHIYKVP